MSYADRRLIVYCPMPDLTEEMVLMIWDACEIEFELQTDIDDQSISHLIMRNGIERVNKRTAKKVKKRKT